MIAILLGLLFSLSSIDQAERAYSAGMYQEAITLFQAALDDNEAQNGPILYNMGNCAFRLGRYAEAVLFYRRAQIRMPRDSQVRFNLDMSEQKLGIYSEEGETFGAAIVDLADSFTPGEHLAFAGVLQVVGLLGLALFRGKRRVRNLMALLLLLSFLGATRLVYTQWLANQRDGVILVNEIELRTEPHVDREVVSRLKNGETVSIEEMSDKWIRITHHDGNGWTKRSGIGVVD